MQIKKNHVVTLHYRLTENNMEGELLEETYSSEPLKFIFGVGMMLPSFEEFLEEKVADDTFAFILKSEDAYGAYENDAVVDIPIQSFMDENGDVDMDRLAVGNPLQMSDQEGRSYHGIVMESKDESILIDFNHPMAGKTLHFKGEILEVRDATETELDHGHVH
jgi:FKBP-type peptidyl-prolyl cis-trans isomerase SlyD